MKPAPTRTGVLWALAALVALGAAVRFATLGLQSYHHDEVITVARVIPGSFADMLREVKGSESNPPLYYVLAWGWAKAFGTGEVTMRSLSALFGLATVPLAYCVGRELSSRRAGLIAAALVAVNPMLIWYSQEARSYALLVFFGAAALLFFARAPCALATRGTWRSGRSRPGLRCAAITSPSSRWASRRSGCSSRCARAGGPSCRRLAAWRSSALP